MLLVSATPGGPLTPARFQQFMTSSRRDKSVYNLSADEALALDAMLAVLSGLNDLLADEEGVKIFKSTFRRREMYNVDMKGIQCWNRNITPWTHGPAIKRALEKVKISGWTGPIAFDEHGVRQNHTLEILHLTYRSPLKKVRNLYVSLLFSNKLSYLSIDARNINESPFMMQKCPSAW
ncbi:hypothetical protein C0Q70_05421 [Pomacea canaliculata]|uniref:Receptor ligand binding region domain-containing protein n=1 Tax=Pomacea canaliculata TaxID=400727 RepID=A0A2T7PL62_POMCA|nr:hypothetical protein C0Q70_05421 [Pomacea canaliculata]